MAVGLERPGEVNRDPSQQSDCIKYSYSVKTKGRVQRNGLKTMRTLSWRGGVNPWTSCHRMESEQFSKEEWKKWLKMVTIRCCRNISVYQHLFPEEVIKSPLHHPLHQIKGLFSYMMCSSVFLQSGRCWKWCFQFVLSWWRGGATMKTDILLLTCDFNRVPEMFWLCILSTYQINSEWLQ